MKSFWISQVRINLYYFSITYLYLYYGIFITLSYFIIRGEAFVPITPITHFLLGMIILFLGTAAILSLAPSTE